ncbi:MAG TPA: DNA topoisomerase 3 [Candidatus Limiplasma sp.]|nr:DNA topoisomerase 3 [Candidatus Limiplasma sp.]HPS81075.1 DNA topoisomerase 3 [Candidatus Limiplasma sp.]
MGKTLIVAEKPSVARDLAHALSVKQKGEGCLVSPDYTVTWAIGHLVRLAEPDELNPGNRKWALESLPILPDQWELKAISKTRAQLATVKRLMKDRTFETVVCATDAGREGELIFRWIYEVAGCRIPCQRLWISSMTAEAIREGMAALRPAAEYDALFQSALCRARADWLIGMNMSRVFTVKYKSLLSVGRVQTPTLALLVRRQQEIEQFKPEKSYGIPADFGDYTGVYAVNRKERQFSARAEAEVIAQAVRGQTGTVVESTREAFAEAPPQLFDLTTLQREANRRFGITAKRTLTAAQSLYEKHKVITYPRTESRYLTFDLKPKVRQALEALPEPFSAHAQAALEGLAAMQGGRVFRKELDADHHALIPTGKAIVLEKLGADERKVLELILARFSAAFLPPAEGEKRTVITRVGDHEFLSQTSQILRPGWKAVEGNPEKNAPLPELAVGDSRAVIGAAVKEHTTEPPKPYTDATLLYAMEHAGRQIEDEQLASAMKKHGLGTPATRAAILERLIEVGYAERQQRAILPTLKGVRFIGIVPETLASPELTGKWEYGLNEIAERKTVDAAFIERFMTGVTKLTADMVAAVKADTRTVDLPHENPKFKGKRPRATASSGIPCPVCGKGRVTENDRAFGCSRWKLGCAFTLWKDALTRYGGPALTLAIVTPLLRDGHVRGSTGTIVLAGQTIRFQFANSTEVTPPVGIEQKKPPTVKRSR